MKPAYSIPTFQPMANRFPRALLRIGATLLTFLAIPLAHAADPPASPLIFPPATAPGDLPTARQSRPLAAWSPAVTLTSRVEQLPEGPALSLSPAIAIGLFDHLELGAAFPIRFREAGTAPAWQFWAKAAIPGARREPAGAGAGAAVTIDLRAPGFAPRFDSFILSPGLVFDNRTRWGFLHAYHIRADLGLDGNGHVAWAQVDAGSGASFPIARSFGLWLWAAVDTTFQPAALPKSILELPFAAHAGLQERPGAGLYLNAGFGVEMGRGLGGGPGWVGLLSLGWTPDGTAEGKALARSKEAPSLADDDCNVLLSGDVPPRPERRFAGGIPPEPPGKPCLAHPHAERYVDFFREASYSPSYRFDPKSGAVSTFLQLRHPDGTRIDVDYREIGDEQPDAETFRRQVKNGRIGEGGRIFPARMNRRTTPRLWEAKQYAIAIIDRDFEELMGLATAGVMLTLPIPVGGLRPAPSEAFGPPRVPERRFELGRPRRESVGLRAPEAGGPTAKDEISPPAASKLDGESGISHQVPELRQAEPGQGGSKGGAPGSRPGQPFTKVGKKEVWSQNAAKHEGVNKCDNCGVEVVKPQRHTKGIKPPGNEGHVDHATAKAKGGSGTPDNGQVLCRDCNLQKGSQ